MDANEDLEQFSGEWLEQNKDIMCMFMEQYATLKVMLELESIKKDIKALNKIKSPLCCDDIDEQIKQLRGLQLKMLKK